MINPGSTSTKVAVFEGEHPLIEQSLTHCREELVDFSQIWDQLDFRKQRTFDFLRKSRFTAKGFAALVGRGELIRPLQGGTYLVNQRMIEAARKGPAR